MISFKPLRHTLVEKDMTFTKLIRVSNVSKSTIDRMNAGKPITTETLDKLCSALDCSVSDIIEHIKDY